MQAFQQAENYFVSNCLNYIDISLWYDCKG